MFSSLKSELDHHLKKSNIKPNKNLGQCFLVSEGALSKIIEAGEIKKGDKILEIGAGTGILTQELLKRGALVVAVEKDARLFEILKKKFGEAQKNKKIFLLKGDFLRLKFPNFLIERGFSRRNFKVIANLPYQITSPVLKMLCEKDFLPLSILLTIQKEVAQRICAKPGAINSLAVMVQAVSKNVRILSTFPPSNFYPSPKVNSALIKIEGLAHPEGIKIEDLRAVIKAGFGSKRKKLKKNLEKAFPKSKEKIETLWKELKLEENLRAQDLEVSQWVELAKRVKK